MMGKSDDQLRAYYSKREQDLMFHHPAGPQTGADGHMLYGAICYDKLIGGLPLAKELERRGYDLKTLKFSIEKDPTHKRWAPTDVQRTEQEK
jgi:hypothetical protein